MPSVSSFTRSDLPALRALDRSQVFAALRSFDDRGLAEDEFAWRALALMDTARVPGLAEAMTARDLNRALASVHAACVKPLPAWPAEFNDAARALADDALENRFSFYGEKYALPASIDWNFNPGTAHWTHDLNRFSYLSPLVQAYLATGDTRYSRKAVDLILDWIAKCDFAVSFQMKPYAFGSYLNLGIHSAQWSRAIRALAARDQVTPRQLLRILKSLHDHLAYLEIVTNGHAGNWPTIGVMGMLGTLEHMPILRDTDRFAAYGKTTMAAQIAEQVLPDGVQDELTPHYHQVVVNNLVSARRSLLSLQQDLDAGTLDTLRKMVHYTQQTVTPDGRKHVAFNDSDPAAVPDLKMLLGSVGLGEILRRPEELGPEAYPYAGVTFLRQRQDRGDLYLAFDAGPFGRSHQHEDKLGFWLFAYGRNFLVDPGRHLYDHTVVSYYDYLITTRAHSTILVDGQGQNNRRRRDHWIAKAPIDLQWRTSDEETRATGVYDLGYGPDGSINVVHRRTVVFVRQSCWVLFDELSGEGEHLIESRFQFAPGTLRWNDTQAVTGFPDANLLLRPISAGAALSALIQEGQENPRAGWYSNDYKKIEPAPALVLSCTSALPSRMATLLLPFRGVDPPKLTFEFDGAVARVGLPNLGLMEVLATSRPSHP